MSEATPECRTCVHFWITHRAERPYGCRRFEFVSQRLPAIEIRESSGRECLAHEPRGDSVTGRRGTPGRS